jgi:hypothetical protein
MRLYTGLYASQTPESQAQTPESQVGADLSDCIRWMRLIFSVTALDLTDVRIAVTGDISRPPFEKNAGTAMLFDHAKVLAMGIGLNLADCSTGGASDGISSKRVGPDPYRRAKTIPPVASVKNSKPPSISTKKVASGTRPA